MGGMVRFATRVEGNGTGEVWWGLLQGWGWKRNRGGMVGLATRVGGEQETGKVWGACYRNTEKRRRNGGACYKAGEGNTEQGRYGGHATREGTGGTMKRVSSLHLMSQIPTPQATTFRRHKRGASPVYSFPAKPLSLIQAPLPCSKLLETRCAGCLPLSVCMTAKLSHSNLQHDARLTSKTEMFCPKQVFFFHLCLFFMRPRAFRFHFVLLRKC